MKKAILAIALCGVLALGMAGCGQADSRSKRQSTHGQNGI